MSKDNIRPITIEHIQRYGDIYAKAFSGEPWNNPWKTEDAVIHAGHLVLYKTDEGPDESQILVLAERAFGERYERKTLLKWLKVFFKRFFSQQFKRSCIPDGPKVGSVSLSPRGDWRMPSDATSELWLSQLEAL